MARILLFPSPKPPSGTQCARVSPPNNMVMAPDVGDATVEDDAPDGVSLAQISYLAAAPSPTLNALSKKVEVLMARLAPDDGADAGLCGAEIQLLRSVLRDLRAFAADLVFAAQGAGLTESGNA